jgi:hypothetical protein
MRVADTPREQAATLILQRAVVLQRDPLGEVVERDEAVRVLSKMFDENRAVLVSDSRTPKQPDWRSNQCVHIVVSTMWLIGTCVALQEV